MVLGHCKTCGEEIRSRRSDKHSAQANFLAAVRRHYKKKHPETLSRRISKGLRRSNENPSFQDMVSAMKEGPRSIMKVYGSWTERQYQHMKGVMDALEPVLPPEIVVSWKVLEALHDKDE